MFRINLFKMLPCLWLAACGVNGKPTEEVKQSEIKPMPKEARAAQPGRSVDSNDSQSPQQVSFIENDDPRIQRFQQESHLALSQTADKAKYQCMFRLDRCDKLPSFQGRFAVVGEPRVIPDFADQCDAWARQFLAVKCGEGAQFQHVIFSVE